MTNKILSIGLIGMFIASLTACSSDDHTAEPPSQASKYKVEISHEGKTEAFTQMLNVSLGVNEGQKVEISSDFQFDGAGTYPTPQLYQLVYTGAVQNITFETVSPVNEIAVMHMLSTQSNETLNTTIKIYKNGSLVKQQTNTMTKDNWQYNLSVR